MNFVNETGLEAGWNVGLGREGRETLMVAVKATFDFPQNGGRPLRSQKQLPLVAGAFAHGRRRWKPGGGRARLVE